MIMKYLIDKHKQDKREGTPTDCRGPNDHKGTLKL